MDSIADLVKDLYTQISPYYYVRLGVKNGDIEKLKKEHLLPAVESKFPIFQKYLREAHSGFYAKSGLTYVDFIVAEFFDIINSMNPEVFEAYPDLIKHVERIHDLPNLKPYIESRPSAHADIKQ